MEERRLITTLSKMFLLFRSSFLSRIQQKKVKVEATDIFGLCFVAAKPPVPGMGGGGGGGYSSNFLVGMCRWDPGTQNLYQS